MKAFAPEVASRIEALTVSIALLADTNAKATVAGKARNGASGSVTSDCIALALAMLEANERVTVIQRKLNLKERRGEPPTNHRIASALNDAKVDPATASMAATLACWCAMHPAIPASLYNKSGEPVGLKKAYAAARFAALGPDPIATAVERVQAMAKSLIAQIKDGDIPPADVPSADDMESALLDLMFGADPDAE